MSSVRVSAAQARVLERRDQKFFQMRRLGWAVIAIVGISTLNGDPKPAWHGRALVISIALAVYVAAMLLVMFRRGAFGAAGDILVILLVGASGITLAAAQPDGSAELAPSVAVFVASLRLAPPPVVAAISGSIAAGLGITSGLTQHPAGEAVLSALLLCTLLVLVGHLMRRSGETEERSQLLLAELQDARDAEAEAAAVAERGRIAGELHDVLAHSLSGLAIQIEGARMLADREQVSPRLAATIGRSAELVKEGLREARQAVGALRGDRPPGIADLAGLVERFGRDAGITADLVVDGTPLQVSPDADIALYRGAQEALTNVARYAPSSVTTVQLRYDADSVALVVTDRIAVTDQTAAPVAALPLAGVGGGNGLAAMRDRVTRAGGTVVAGPIENGWRVELEVPSP